MDKKTPLVCVGVPSAGFLRHSQFIDYYNQLEKPAGTLLATAHGASPARGRNTIIAAALQQKCTHILFLDDDMVPPKEMLVRLLEHDKDIVSGLYLLRTFPHFPVMFEKTFNDGKSLHKFLTPDVEGLVEVENTGFGAVLIKTEVFRAMDKPWVTLGEFEKDHWCDDLSFFYRARKKGFRIFVDTDCHVGHLGQVILFPRFDSDTKNWMTVLNTGGTNLQFPQTIPDMADYDENGNLKTEPANAK